MKATPDFGATAGDYARHRAGFPDSLFDRLIGFGIGRAGQAVADIGTGTGSLARHFARRGCHVTGIDISAGMLEQARALAAAEGLRADFRVGRAEDTGLPGSSIDVVSAGQCWHWFDRPRAAIEVARILKADGRVVIAHFDWLPLAGNVVEATEGLIEQHNPDWDLGGALGLYPRWLRDLGEAGFRDLQSFSYDVDVPYTHEAWRGRIRASAGVGASLSADKVDAFDRALAALLRERFPADPVAVPHRVFAIVGRAPGTG
jgi:SAM-dependent methyltransferase